MHVQFSPSCKATIPRCLTRRGSTPSARMTDGPGARPVQPLLQSDDSPLPDAPWIHAFGEDDEVGRAESSAGARALLLRRDGSLLLAAPWVHACGEDDGVTMSTGSESSLSRARRLRKIFLGFRCRTQIRYRRPVDDLAVWIEP